MVVPCDDARAVRPLTERLCLRYGLINVVMVISRHWQTALTGDFPIQYVHCGAPQRFI